MRLIFGLVVVLGLVCGSVVGAPYHRGYSGFGFGPGFVQPSFGYYAQPGFYPGYYPGYSPYPVVGPGYYPGYYQPYRPGFQLSLPRFQLWVR